MKRRNHLIDPIAEYPNLLLAFSKAARGRRYRGNVRAFAGDLSGRLDRMSDGIRSGKIEIGDYQRFVVHDPKQRVIHAAAFPERVLHHAIMNIVGEDFERGAIDQSYACRTGKGNRAAIRQALHYHHRHRFFLKLDIRRFFDSVDHEILKEEFRHLFKDRAFLELLGRIVGSFETEPGKGLPIGTLTSQFFANFYLDRFDRFVKEGLKCRAYARFMDDFVLWHDEEAQLNKWLEAIEAWLAGERRLMLKGENHRPMPTNAGLPFLGYRLMRDGRILLGRSARKRFRRRLSENEAACRDGWISEQDLQRRTDALLAFVDVAEANQWRRRLLKGRDIGEWD